MKLYVFRHGLTHEAKENIPYTADTVKTSPLLPEGIPAIERQAHYLKNIKTDANYTSPYLRCIQTVEIMSEISGKSFLPNELFGEYASWEEPFDLFHKRMERALGYLNSQHLESAAICTHGGVISAFKYLLVYGKYETQDVTDYPNPGILTIIDGGKFEEIDFN